MPRFIRRTTLLAVSAWVTVLGLYGAQAAGFPVSSSWIDRSWTVAVALSAVVFFEGRQRVTDQRADRRAERVLDAVTVQCDESYNLGYHLGWYEATQHYSPGQPDAKVLPFPAAIGEAVRSAATADETTVELSAGSAALAPRRGQRPAPRPRRH